MGQLAYIGWSVLMASAILFSTLLGIVLGEWRNTSARTRLLLALGLVFLVASSVISGYSGYLKRSREHLCQSRGHPWRPTAYG